MSNYHPNAKKIDFGPLVHDQKLQIEFLRKLCDSDNRIKIDETLSAILYKNG